MTVNTPPKDTPLNLLDRLSRPLPGWAIGTLLLILSLLFMRRALLTPPGQTMSGYDVASSFYTWAKFTADLLRSGQAPFWNPYQFAGEPFLSNPQVALFYPPQWLVLALPLNVSLAWYYVIHIWLAGFGMYVFTFRLTKHQTGALMAAFTFMFSGLTAGRIAEGHLTLLAVLIWTPWVLVAYHWAVKRQTWWAGVLSGLPFGLSLLAGNPPIVVYLALIWGSYAIVLWISYPAHRRMVIQQGLLIGVVGLALAAVQFIPLMTVYRLSTRNPAFYISGTSGSMPLHHFITLVAPDFYGDYVVGYFGANSFHEFCYYAGLLPLVALPLALRRPDRRIWWGLALMAFGLLAALGQNTPLYPVLRVVIFPLRWVRVPARAAFLYVFGGSVLLAEVARQWDAALSLSRRVWLRAVSLMVVGLAGLTWLYTQRQMRHSHQLHIDTAARLPHQLNSLLAVAAGVIVIVLLIRFAFSATRGKDGWWVLGARWGLALFVLADVAIFSIWSVDSWPTGPDNWLVQAQSFFPDNQYRYLRSKDAKPVFADAILIQALAVDGYNPIRLLAHDRLVAAAGEDYASPIYDVLAVRYLLSNIDLSAAERLPLLGRADSLFVYERPSALPLARLVSRYEVILLPNEGVARLESRAIDPAETVILSETPPCQPGLADPGDRADIVAMDPGYWQIDTRSAHTALLVLSETSYPGWRVTIDDLPAQPLVAYTSLKAVCVPPGQHRVEWRYTPPGLAGGAILSSMTVVLLVVCAIQLRADNVHRQRQGESQLV